MSGIYISGKKQNSGNKIFLVQLILVVLCSVGWIQNLVKLAGCDFEAPYKAEVIHGIGLVPVVGMVTGWLDVGR